MKDLSKKILETIKKENIKPRSKLYFWVKNILHLMATVIATLFSAFFISTAFFLISNQITIRPKGFVIFFAVGLIFIVITFFLAYKQFILIKKIYKYNTHYVLVAFLSLVCALGFVFAQFRTYAYIDTMISEKIPYLSVHDYMHKQWSQPELGMLAGEVVGVSDNGYILLQGFDNTIYTIDPVFLEDEERLLFINHLRVKLIGYEEEDFFYPHSIYPWLVKNTIIKRHKYLDRPIINGNIDFSKNL